MMPPRRVLKFIGVTAALAALCLLASYYVILPMYAAQRLQTLLGAGCDARVRVGSVQYNFRDQLLLRGLLLATARGHTLMRAEEVRIQFDGNVLGGIKQIHIIGGIVAATRDADGSWNWREAWREGDAAQASSGAGAAAALPAEILLQDCTLRLRVMDPGKDEFQVAITGLQGGLARRDRRYVLENMRGVCCRGAAQAVGDIQLDTLAYDIRGLIQDARIEDLFAESPDKTKQLAGALTVHLRYNRDPEAGAAHTFSGSADIRDGFLWELSLFERMMKVLKYSGIKLMKFDEAHIRFYYRGSHLTIPDAQFLSDSISFHGTGYLEPTGAIDFDFVPRLGRKAKVEDIPLFGEFGKQMLGGMEQNLMKIHVTGTLFQPHTMVEPLGPLSELSGSVQKFLK